MDDLFETGGTETEPRVLARLKKDSQVGSEDWNDVLFTRQGIRWMKDPQFATFIEVSRERSIEDLEEIPVAKNKGISTVLLQCTQGFEAFWDW